MLHTNAPQKPTGEKQAGEVTEQEYRCLDNTRDFRTETSEQTVRLSKLESTIWTVLASGAQDNFLNYKFVLGLLFLRVATSSWCPHHHQKIKPYQDKGLSAGPPSSLFNCFQFKHKRI